jgi:hypothetical protein
MTNISNNKLKSILHNITICKVSKKREKKL